MAIPKAICSDPECNRPSHSRGLCSMHYKRYRSSNGPMPPLVRVKGVCSIEGCDKPHHIRGYCQMHFARLRRHGDPEFTKTSPEGAGLEMLMALVGHNGEDCVTWPYSRNPQGYGQTYFCGEVMGAHRVMCILAHGSPPSPSHQAAHSCGRGSGGCVNPEHLRWATAKENIADKFNLHGWRIVHKNGAIAGITRD